MRRASPTSSRRADIPLIAIDVPHPNATYFGVDNFEAGYEVGALLAQHAQRKWKGNVDRVIGVGFSEAGSFVQSRITGAFDGIRERLPDLTPDKLPLDRRPRHEGTQPQGHEGCSARPPRRASASWWPPTTDSSALGVLDAAREAGCEQDFAIAGQDCIPEVLEEMRSGKSALIGSISHEVETYGPRLIQLGIALLRGNIVPPYNYVRHRAVTPETLSAEKGALGTARKALVLAGIEEESGSG